MSAAARGAMAKALVDTFSGLKCTVLDLPQVVAGLEGSNNLRFVSGDMFQFIPPTDAVFLKRIMHDWSDENCVKILGKCKEAIIPSKNNGGKFVHNMEHRTVKHLIITQVSYEEGS
ncbi:hypothetical protein C2S52_012934 [Perilla frutescens var. hirtella]|nr:hypothetical protein C2S52_012934 [Perilla frutescens var. hirtella]